MRTIRIAFAVFTCAALASVSAPVTRAAIAPTLPPAAAPAPAAPAPATPAAAASTAAAPAKTKAAAGAKTDATKSADGGSDVNLGFDSSKPIDVNADNFAADLKNNIGTYTGNVVVLQGMLKMSADTVVVNAPQGKATHMEAHGHVVIISPSGVATGENGVYEVGDRVMHIMGNVVLTKEQSVMRGSQADMEVATGQSHLIASNATVGPDGQTKPGRVQALFIPADKPDDAAKPAAAKPAEPAKSAPKR